MSHSNRGLSLVNPNIEMEAPLLQLPWERPTVWGSCKIRLTRTKHASAKQNCVLVDASCAPCVNDRPRAAIAPIMSGPVNNGSRFLFPRWSVKTASLLGKNAIAPKNRGMTVSCDIKFGEYLVPASKKTAYCRFVLFPLTLQTRVSSS
jgi:hypothetical protein